MWHSQERAGRHERGDREFMHSSKTKCTATPKSRNMETSRRYHRSGKAGASVDRDTVGGTSSQPQSRSERNGELSSDNQGQRTWKHHNEEKYRGTTHTEAVRLQLSRNRRVPGEGPGRPLLLHSLCRKPRTYNESHDTRNREWQKRRHIELQPAPVA